MSDADRQWNHGPLQPMAPDDWHDRKQAKRGMIRAMLFGALLAYTLVLVFG